MEIAARLNVGEMLADRIIKVDHAGEHGAVNIYRGQIFVCRLLGSDLLSELREFKRHEERHREIFAEEMRKRGVRRCRSYQLCGLGGLLLGLVTALCGKSAIAATTLAVERVVLQHLQEQLDYLAERDETAFRAISAIFDDERAHHDRSALAAAQGRFWPRVLLPIVSASTEAVIWVGMRI